MSGSEAKTPAKKAISDDLTQIQRNIDYYTRLLERFAEEMDRLTGHCKHAHDMLARWKAAYDVVEAKEAENEAENG